MTKDFYIKNSTSIYLIKFSQIKDHKYGIPHKH